MLKTSPSLIILTLTYKTDPVLQMQYIVTLKFGQKKTHALYLKFSQTLKYTNKVVPSMTEDCLCYYEYIMTRNFNSKSQELLTVD